ncbi:sigma-70 family RNA polymerase sigma factor [Streptomyces sp. AV19]|uniref:sigma-70 family RNA polymerase sigma factor n=1 Tax=Streptomyces sp. AV19 TaxID=2793068 RepID=UPI0018FEBEBE|nr:sigma-70 family RNA polymerase sigma factor [Streptomyces sp. AV19]MBH1936999.1 sigma-70 family RNA polymerase sigma factor [Streptomyces sp. AV19]MDG4530920.1 sigma-70 family RNA polymerase sigma factor [Streptomyces sp. AV19]
MGVDGREEPHGSEESSAAASHRAPPGVPGQGGPRGRARGRHGGGPSVPQQRGGEWGDSFDAAVSRSREDASGRSEADTRGTEARSSDDDGADVEVGAGEPGETEPDEREAPPSDAELIARLRDGEDPGADSYALLYRRHADAVRGYARSCCRDVHTAEDLTNEVFAGTLQAVRRGAGPDTAVRAYLLTTVRRVAAAWAKTARREQLVEDFAVFAVSAGSAGEDDDTPGAEVHAMRQAETSLAVQAFRSLPERWQMVLWHTTVEEEPPSQVAPLLGLSANATAVLAHRAREGLRQAYLQAHVSASLTSAGSCAQYADRLGAYARGGLRMRAERGLRKHLDECDRCRTAALELADVNARLRAVLPVAVVGWFTAGGAAKAVAGLAAGAAGAGAGVAAGGAGSGGGAAAGEGLGAPAKVALGAGAVLTAGAVLAYALSGGAAGPPRKPEAGRPVVSAAPSHRPSPDPSPTPTRTPGPTVSPSSPPPPPEPRRVAARAVAPSPAPTPSATPSPAPSPSHTPRPAPPPRPVPSPPPPKPPKPVPPPSAPATVHHLNELDLDALGDGGNGADREPEVRIDEGSLMWQRDGLRVGGHTYLHGVSVGTTSSVAIDLNGPCTAYDAMAGVDDLSLGDGAVRFSVSADGERLWESPVLRSGDAAVPVHVPLEGQRALRLEVEGVSPYDGEIALADWALARVVCG